jgi:hypothetical protein
MALRRFAYYRKWCLAVVTGSLFFVGADWSSAIQDGQAAPTRRVKKAMELIGSVSNPAAIIRATNKLIRMGNDGVRLAFSTARYVSDLGPELQSAMAGVGRESLVLLAAYQRKDFVWPPNTTFENDGAQEQLANLSNVFPIVWCGTIPFAVDDDWFLASCDLRRPVQEGHTYGIHPLSDFMTWASSHATLRTSTVRPPDDPFGAVEEALRQIGQSEDLRLTLGSRGLMALARSLRLQCVAMTEGVLDEAAQAFLTPESSPKDPRDALWAAYCSAVTQRRIRWEQDEEKYVSTGS